MDVFIIQVDNSLIHKIQLRSLKLRKQNKLSTVIMVASSSTLADLLEIQLMNLSITGLLLAFTSNEDKPASGTVTSHDGHGSSATATVTMSSLHPKHIVLQFADAGPSFSWYGANN
jgi:hypothetical protein